jgi:NAD-reducing hydrogenase large subunit
VARQGVLLRKFGQEVIRLTAGKRVHGTGAIPGGVNRALSRAERDGLLADIDQIVGWSRAAVQIVKRLHAADPALYDSFGTFRSNILSLVGADGALDFYDGRLRARDADGGILVDGFAVENYQQLIHEEVKPWSYMKFPFLAALGPQRRLVQGRAAGARAELRLRSRRRWPKPSAASSSTTARAPIHAPLAYHWARMIEMLHAAETIKDLLHDDDLSGSELSCSGAAGTRASASSKRRAAP